MAQQSADENAARRVVSGSEFTTTIGSPAGATEVLVDGKTPGSRYAEDARSYYAGTLLLQDTLTSSPEFASAPMPRAHSGLQPFYVNGYKQVASVHCRNADNSIAWQRHFYGISGTEWGRWTNARAISVWPAETDSDTRVAICGETTEQQLPLSQLSQPLSSATPNQATGFLAVFDGAGTLLWTYQFFGHNFSEHCAITDLSIRVEVVGTQSYDVVTYCGISSHGNPGGGTPLTPLLPFDAPPGLVGFYTGGAGDSQTGAGQWDGIVGRLKRSHAGGNAVPVFHSLVGGTEMDAVLGLAELTEDWFVVVGHTKRLSSLQSLLAFPFTESNADWNNALGSTPNYSVAALMVFDALATRSNGDLVLKASHPMGHLGDMESLARDVCAASMGGGAHSVFVVGSTNDGTSDSNNFLTSCDSSLGDLLSGTSPSELFHQGSRDGFLIHALVFQPAVNTSPVLYLSGAFVGGEAVDDLTGVAMWNEVPEQCVVFGTTSSSGAGGDDLLVSHWADTSTGSPYMQPIREDVIGSTSSEYAAPMGPQHAMTQKPYLTSMGSPAGGGVAMDARGRVMIVGAANSAGAPEEYPVVGGDAPRGGIDGVRTVFDMLPERVWRTDGTGTRAAAFGAVPDPAGSFYDGGTSPTSCIEGFGVQIGGPTVALRRMFINYLGSAPAQGVSDAVVNIESVPPGYTIVAGLMQYGILDTPGGSPGSTIELWAPNNPAVLGVDTTLWPLFPTGGGMPSGSHEFVVQVVYLLSSTLPCDAGASLAMAASPGLVFGY